MSDPFLQDDGETLKNRLGIVGDPEELRFQEREYTRLRAKTVHEEVSGKFDAGHLKAIHRHIFQDVYEWAGTTRGDTITLEGELIHVPSAVAVLSKGSTNFLPSAYMERGLAYVAERAAAPDARSVDPAKFATAATEVFASLNHAHPFREGNGRTQRVFMEQLAMRAGHTLDFRGVTGERMVGASIESHHGDNAALRAIIAESIDPDRVALRIEAVMALDRSGLQANDFWIETLAPGHRADGALLGKFSTHCSVLTEDNRLLIAPASALPDHAELHKPVAFVYERRLALVSEVKALVARDVQSEVQQHRLVEAVDQSLGREAARELKMGISEVLCEFGDRDAQIDLAEKYLQAEQALGRNREVALTVVSKDRELHQMDKEDARSQELDRADAQHRERNRDQGLER